jgi:hypothetical protein
MVIFAYRLIHGWLTCSSAQSALAGQYLFPLSCQSPTSWCVYRTIAVLPTSLDRLVPSSTVPVGSDPEKFKKLISFQSSFAHPTPERALVYCLRRDQTKRPLLGEFQTLHPAAGENSMRPVTK